MRRGGAIHAMAWALWLTAVVILLSVTRNPLYIALVLLWVAVVTSSAALAQPLAPRLLSPWRFGLVVMPTAALINGLHVHVGATVLLTLPPTLPLIGGPLTLEAVVYGAVNGLAITTLLAACTLVMRALTVHEVIGLIPRAYYPVAVVATIALTFAPLTLRQWQAIREAQAVRGHQMRGVRDWLPLFLPLLLSGLERALQLAEAMSARGFGDTVEQSQTPLTRLGLVIGLSSVVGGLWLRLSDSAPTTGWLLVLAGVGLVFSLLWWIGRRSARTAYRPAPLQATDWAVIGGALAATLLFLLPWPGLDRTPLFFYPYPTLTIPGFGLPLALATWGLLTPAFVLVRRYAIERQQQQP